MQLLKNGKIIDDKWAGAILTLEQWEAESSALKAQNKPLGLLLTAGQFPEDIAENLDNFEVIALEFSAFTDGRSYTSARQLRERYGFQGEIRAVGNVLVDQYRAMLRCGFDAFEISESRDVEKWEKISNDVSVTYQPAIDGRATRSSVIAPCGEARNADG